MPNPSEMYRKEVEERNDELKKYETSRNTLSSNTDHHRWCQELRELRNKMTQGRLCKSDKENVLARIRELGRLTGFDIPDYNSNEFKNFLTN